MVPPRRGSTRIAQAGIPIDGSMSMGCRTSGARSWVRMHTEPRAPEGHCEALESCAPGVNLGAAGEIAGLQGITGLGSTLVSGGQARAAHQPIDRRRQETSPAEPAGADPPLPPSYYCETVKLWRNAPGTRPDFPIKPLIAKTLLRIHWSLPKPVSDRSALWMTSHMDLNKCLEATGSRRIGEIPPLSL